MAVKIGNLDISAFKVGSADTKVYLGDTLLYPTTPPSFQGKWLATYSDSHTESAECDASSAITYTDTLNMGGVVQVEIGSCVTSIGNNAFDAMGVDFSYLSSVTIPNSVTSIGTYAFNLCISLTSVGVVGSGASVEIPSGVTSISNGSFFSCRGLTSVTIPDSVTSIGNNAFAQCRSLTSITVNATTPPTLANTNAFTNTNNCPIYVPSGSVETYKSASGWSDYASRIQAIP